VTFIISALDSSQFDHLIELDDDSLAKHSAKRMRANTKSAFPCRVTLEDAEIGETVLLLNYEHLDVESPYRSSHAIFVREEMKTCPPIIDDVPTQLKTRLLSIRAFNDGGMMIDADVTSGQTCGTVIERLLAIHGVEYLHIHYAKPGCYAARVDRHAPDMRLP